MSPTIASQWQHRLVPDIEGITLSTGTGYTVDASGLGPREPAEPFGWLSFDMLDSNDLHGGNYRVRCGETSSHGSIGIVVLEDARDGGLIWSLVSGDGNPFDQVTVKGAHILVLSTSGSVFRFRAELEEAALFVS